MLQNVYAAEIESTRVNPHIDPVLHIWGWEVPVYLFLGGLVAGLLVLSSLATLRKREEDMPTSARLLPLLSVPLLGVGMLALFLDLEYKLHVFRFYTTFQWSSPMSWGSWILLLVFAASGASALGVLEARNESWAAAILRLPFLRKIGRLARRNERRLAVLCASLGIALGIYTGILISAFAARPLWNSSVLGLLFLASGLSSGAALAALLARGEREKRSLVRIDLGLIIAEALLVALWLLGLGSSGEPGREALGLFFGGSYTAVFWLLVVGIGLALPILLELMELRGRWHSARVAPLLVLVGGLALRFVIVGAGQLSQVGG